MKAKRHLVTNVTEEWLKKCPHQLRGIAVKDAYEALSSGMRKLKAKLIPKFELKFRSRKKPQQSCFIPKTAIKQNDIYVKKIGKIRMHGIIPEKENMCDSRLVYNNKRWFLHIPYKTKVICTENQGRTIALDVGIRTFVTSYSGENCVCKIGTGDFKRITRLLIVVDRYYSLISKAKCRVKYKLKKKICKIRNKISDLTDELHFKTIKFITDNFDRIVLPEFNTQDMVIKRSRKIRSKTVRSLLSFSFFKFSQRLIAKASSINKVVIRCSEAYTSKTASWTGEIIHNLGGKKYISSDGITVDRDINGARGIFLRALVDKPLTDSSVLYC